MTKKKQILFITGTRADFGKLKSLMTATERSKGFQCNIFATGMHALLRHGMTYNEIKKANFKNIFLFMNQGDTTSSDMDHVVANTVSGLANYIRVFRPDLIVVHGDRPEALAGAIVGVLNNILVAHIEGGEISGTVDELIRHSVSKLSHIHCVANQKARKRLIQLGEKPSSIYTIGSPEVDIMLSDRIPSLRKVQTHYAIPFKNYGIFCYHPVTTELESLPQKIQMIVTALLKSEQNFVVIEPNNDRGSDIIYNALQPLRRHPRFRVFCSMRFEYYISLLKHAKMVVGNSSSGIRESGLFGVLCINIGTRQKDRLSDKTIVNVKENEGEILKAITECLGHRPVKYHFGRGHSARDFMKMLTPALFWKTSIQKQFCDISF